MLHIFFALGVIYSLLVLECEGRDILPSQFQNPNYTTQKAPGYRLEPKQYVPWFPRNPRTLPRMTDIYYYHRFLSHLGRRDPTRTVHSSYPTTGAVFAESSFICTGNLVHPSWVVVPAACVAHRGEPVYRVVFGDMVDATGGTPGYAHAVKKVVVHPAYQKGKLHDIALIELEKPVRHGTATVAQIVEHRLDEPHYRLKRRGYSAGYQPERGRRTPKFCDRLFVWPGNCFGPDNYTDSCYDAMFICSMQDNCCPDSLGSALYDKDLTLLGIKNVNGNCPEPDLYTAVDFYVPWMNSVIDSGAYIVVPGLMTAICTALPIFLNTLL